MINRFKKKRFITFNLDICATNNESYNFIIFELNSNLSDRFENYDLIEFFNLIVSLLKKSLDLFRKLIVNSRNT